MTATNQTQPSTPPVGWKQITVDIAIDGASEALRQGGEAAQDVLKETLINAGSGLDAIASAHAYVLVSTVRVGYVGNIIRLTVAVEKGDPNEIAQKIFSIGFSESVGLVTGAALKKFTPISGLWLAGAAVLSGVAGGVYADNLWEDSYKDTPLGDWASSKVVGLEMSYSFAL